MSELNNNKNKTKVVEACKHKTCKNLNLAKCRLKPDIIKVSNDLGQEKVSACLPISVVAARSLYEKEGFGKEDFEKSIKEGIQLWENWRKNNGEKYYMMHFGDIKTNDGKHESIKEFLGKNMNVTSIEKEMGYKHFTKIWSELNAHHLYTAVFTCHSRSYVFGKRNNMYYFLDSHAPDAAIHKSEIEKYPFKKLFYEIYDARFEVIAFL